MTTTTAAPARVVTVGSMAVPGIASLAAGAIHAAAVGVHAEHEQAVIAFTAVAVFQLAWGALALTARHRLVALAGVAGNAAAVAGWIWAKRSGIPFVDGLDHAEAVQFADGAAAALAMLAAFGAAAELTGVRLFAARFAGASALALGFLAVPAMVSAGGHTHAGGDHAHGGGGHDHGEVAAAHDHGDEGDGHDHGEGDDGHDHGELALAHDEDGHGHDDDGHGDDGHAHDDGVAVLASTHSDDGHAHDSGDGGDGHAHDDGTAHTDDHGDDGHAHDPTGPGDDGHAHDPADPSHAHDPTVPGDESHDHDTDDPGHDHDTDDPGHDHDTDDPGHDHDTDTPGHDHDPQTPGDPGHDHDTGDPDDSGPKPYDPTKPIDLGGVEGVTPEQQAAAEALVRGTLEHLPAYADVDDAIAAGFRSIRDSVTGYEHFINWPWVLDDTMLDPEHPESVVYRVADNGDRILEAAMYILPPSYTLETAPPFGGKLTQWHVHDDLCFSMHTGTPTVAGFTRPDGTCAPPLVKLPNAPMIHVWVVANECGPFASLEGAGAGQVPEGEERLCDHAHGHGGGGHDHDTDDPDDSEPPPPTPKPYDPTQPIDLGGVEGVTPEQQAAAEEVVRGTLASLPRYADVADARAAGFRSIGDSVTGYEHFINWSWINDDTILDPEFPESLVYRVQGGTRTLVAAMYILPDHYTLETAPEFGGPLTQWHVHDDLCFTNDPVAPRVAGITTPGGPCAPPLVKLQPAPMIHVWITAHPCGPFAALDGIAGGQVPEGEEVLCDHAHGSH